MKSSNTYLRKKVEDVVRPWMISATLELNRESVPGSPGWKLKSEGRKKVEIVGRKRLTYYTCERSLSGTTWDALTIILITKT